MDGADKTGVAASPLSSILWFATSNIFRQGVTALAALLRPAFMSPELFGVFSTLRLLPNYAHYVHLGARNTMRYMTPLHHANGEFAQAHRLKVTVLTGTMMITAVVVVALVAIGVLGDWPAHIRIGLLISAATVLLTVVYDHFVAELKALQKFRTVSWNNYTFAIVMLVTGVALVIWMGFYGALLAEAIVVAVMVAIMVVRGEIRPSFGFDIALFRSAIALGAPSLLFDVAGLTMRFTDRIVIVSALGYEQLGYYALGAMMLGYIMHVPSATREVMEAKLFENRRGLSPQAAFKKYVLRPIKIVALAMPAVIGLVVLILPALVTSLLPQYTPGIAATQILMLGTYFLAVSFPIRGILVAYGWQGWGAAIQAGCVLLHTGLCLTFVSSGFGIEGVAASAGIAFFAAAAGLFGLVIAKLPERPEGLVADIGQVLLPFPIMLSLLYAVTQFGDWLVWPLWPTLFIKLLVYGLMLALWGALAMRAGLLPFRRTSAMAAQHPVKLT